jgi:signal transduction histidine kinase
VAAGIASVLTLRLFRNSIFRVAILYLLLLSATLLALLGFVYWSTSNLIDHQANETVEAEIQGLAEQYRDEGLSRLVEVIEERTGPGSDRESIYLLADQERHPLAGNLATWPKGKPSSNGWLQMQLPHSDDASGAGRTVVGRMLELTGGLHLFVGRDIQEHNRFRTIVAEALASTLIPAILLGLAGGVLIGRYNQRRVDAVSAIGDQIIKGDLSRRVSLSGTGDEFDRLAQMINDMLDRIETLMAGMSLVTDSLAHDLRSPLTRARSSIELALRKGSDARAYRRALEQTASELEIILRTFESLINIAQAEAGVRRLSLEELDLSALGNDLLEVYQPIAEDAGLALSGDAGPSLKIKGHRQLLGQAIANLFDNAIKYTPAPGQIALAVQQRGDVVMLTIDDSGPGIPPADRERVLQRFVRLDDSRGTPGGGLGLSLVAAVAKLHGASIELSDSTLGASGLRVVIAFPALKGSSAKTAD